MSSPNKLFSKDLSSVAARGLNGRVFKKKKKLLSNGVCVYNNLVVTSPETPAKPSYKYVESPSKAQDKSPSKSQDPFEDDLIQFDELETKSILTHAKKEKFIPSPVVIQEEVPHTQNAIAAMQDFNELKIASVQEKYKNSGIPPHIISKSKLYSRIEDHINIIPKILNAKLHALDYYIAARSQQAQSPHEIMSKDEKWKIDWEKYYGGYYGFKRQLIIGNFINKRFLDLLLQKSSKNKTILYWTISGFSTYVLANEIIIRLIMEDFGCLEEEAGAKAMQTTDYGSVVTDSVEVIDDLEMPPKG